MLADNIRFLRKQAHLTQEDFAERLGDYGKPDQMPTLAGRNMTMIISPKSQKK